MGLTEEMNPYGRGPRRRRTVLIVMLALVSVAVVSVAATVLVTGGGGGGQPVLATASSPSARATVPAAAASAASSAPGPGGVVVLPAPAATSLHGMPVGFPATTEGAVSAIVRWDPLLVPGNEERQLTLLGEVGTEEFVRSTLPVIRASYASRPLRPGFWMTSLPVAHAVVSEGAGTAEVAVLSLEQSSDGSGAASQSGLRVDGYRMRWTGTDWRLDALLTEFSAPAPDVPRSQSPADVRAAGWKEHRLG